MINPNYTEGRFLFVIDNCPRCAIPKEVVPQFNMQVRPDKRIEIIDCTYYDQYGICTDDIIKLYEDLIDGYPILFIGNSRKDGAESVLEYRSWLFGRFFSDFIFPQKNEFLPIIKQPLLFNQFCKYSKGRIVCTPWETE